MTGQIMKKSYLDCDVVWKLPLTAPRYWWLVQKMREEGIHERCVREPASEVTKRQIAGVWEKLKEGKWLMVHSTDYGVLEKVLISVYLTWAAHNGTMWNELDVSDVEKADLSVLENPALCVLSTVGMKGNFFRLPAQVVKLLTKRKRMGLPLVASSTSKTILPVKSDMIKSIGGIYEGFLGPDAKELFALRTTVVILKSNRKEF